MDEFRSIKLKIDRIERSERSFNNLTERKRTTSVNKNNKK